MILVPRKSDTGPVTRGTKYGLGRTAGSGGAMCFRDVNPQVLHAAVSAVVDAGDLIMFTGTADGGAICVRVMSEGRMEDDYPSTAEGLTAALETLAGGPVG